MALEHVTKELYNKSVDDLTNPQEIDRVTFGERERYLEYIFLRQISSEHGMMKHELENLFTMASNAGTRALVYPRTRNDVFGQLQRYHCTQKIQASSKGGFFVQTSGTGCGSGGQGQGDKQY
jgi:hypothetical protein